MKKVYLVVFVLCMMIGHVIAQTPDSRFSRQMEGIQFSPCMNTLSHPVLKKAESAANEKYVSYCEEAAPYLRMTPEIYDMATYFDRMLVDRYVGDKVTKIRVAIGAPVNGLTIWLREKLDEEPVFSMEVPQTSLEEKGWIEVELPADKVYTITENGYYVGYTITSKKYNNNDKTYYPIAIAGNGLLREKTLLYSDDGGKNWVDHTCTFINNGIVAVLGAQTAIVSEHHVDKDLALVNFKSNLAFIKRDPQKEKVRIDFSGYVFNGGTEPVTSFDLTVSAEGIETKTSEVTIKGGLKALKGVILQSYVEIPSNAESANVMLKISNINKGAFTDEYEKNNEGKVEVYFYDRDFVKTSLLEMYTTGYCPNCPYGHKVAEAIPESVNHVKVAHHVGYGEDEFTLQDSYNYMYEFLVKGAPHGTADRTYIQDEAVQSPSFSMGYYDPNEGAKVISGYIGFTQTALPAFASIVVNSTYDENNRELTVRVSGTKESELFDIAMKEPHVNVFLTEDGLVGMQSGASATYVHDHVLRAILGGIWGKEVFWDGNNYTIEFKTILDDAWKAENMNVVAFLTDEDSNSRYFRNVMNAAQTGVNGTSSAITEKNLTDELLVEAINGMVHITGDYQAYRIYDMRGMQVENYKLRSGLYLVSIETAKQTVVKKIVVN